MAGDSDKGRSPPDKWLSATVNRLMDGLVQSWSQGSMSSSVMECVHPSSGGREPEEGGKRERDYVSC